MKLVAEALFKFVMGLVMIGALLLIPAGTIPWMNAILFMCLLFIPMFIAGLFMMKKAPDLLRSRLNSKEKEGEQKSVIALSGLMFISSFIVSGLGVRYGWYTLPLHVVILGSVIFVASYILYAEVLRENRWLSRTIEVQEGQSVVSTGMYGIVRHPMYSVTLFLFLSMPLILGSPWAFLIMLSIYPALLVKRIKNEEKVLSRELPGYGEYMGKVKYRLVPYIW